MNKIILEITADGFKTSVFINNKEYASSYDANENIGKGIDFENTPEIPDGVYDALNSMFPYDCVEALQSID